MMLYDVTPNIILIGRGFNVSSNLRKCNTLHVENFLTTHSALPLVVARGRGCLQTIVGKCVGMSLQCCLTTTVEIYTTTGCLCTCIKNANLAGDCSKKSCEFSCTRVPICVNASVRVYVCACVI